jgi:hypothetical protein
MYATSQWYAGVFFWLWALPACAAPLPVKEQAIESGGKEPGLHKLKEIIEHARVSRANVVFVQPQFSRKAAQTVPDVIGAKLVEADDLAEEWGTNILLGAKALECLARGVDLPGVKHVNVRLDGMCEHCGG